MSQLIPFDSDGEVQNDAVRLVFNFLNDPALKKISDHSIGGTFPLTEFRPGKGSVGKKFWYCYYAHAVAPNPVLFLAAEDSAKNWPRNLKPEDYPHHPEQAKLVRPKTTFAFDDAKYNRKKISDVKKFIQEHADSAKGVAPISGSEVRKHAWAFASLFGDNKQGYCEHPFAHFENYKLETERHMIKEFIEQCGPEIKNVKYFFGLDNTKKANGTYQFAPNRIRVVLFPSDRAKKHIHTKHKSIMLTEDLERSFPPGS